MSLANNIPVHGDLSHSGGNSDIWSRLNKLAATKADLATRKVPADDKAAAYAVAAAYNAVAQQASELIRAVAAVS